MELFMVFELFFGILLFSVGCLGIRHKAWWGRGGWVRGNKGIVLASIAALIGIFVAVRAALFLSNGL